ncbi:unnamed protein product [Amoebophrya sp. A120]|nr:unnamed protein product [Amoebophrya sp. A120]|eukprot:GSA120T00006732001.1
MISITDSSALADCSEKKTLTSGQPIAKSSSSGLSASLRSCSQSKLVDLSATAVPKAANLPSSHLHRHLTNGGNEAAAALEEVEVSLTSEKLPGIPCSVVLERSTSAQTTSENSISTVVPPAAPLDCSSAPSPTTPSASREPSCTSSTDGVASMVVPTTSEPAANAASSMRPPMLSGNASNNPFLTQKTDMLPPALGGSSPCDITFGHGGACSASSSKGEGEAGVPGSASADEGQSIGGAQEAKNVDDNATAKLKRDGIELPLLPGEVETNAAINGACSSTSSAALDFLPTVPSPRDAAGDAAQDTPQLWYESVPTHNLVFARVVSTQSPMDPECTKLVLHDLLEEPNVNGEYETGGKIYYLDYAQLNDAKLRLRELMRYHQTTAMSLKNVHPAKGTGKSFYKQGMKKGSAFPYFSGGAGGTSSGTTAEGEVHTDGEDEKKFYNTFGFWENSETNEIDLEADIWMVDTREDPSPLIFPEKLCLPMENVTKILRFAGEQAYGWRPGCTDKVSLQNITPRLLHDVRRGDLITSSRSDFQLPTISLPLDADPSSEQQDNMKNKEPSPVIWRLLCEGTSPEKSCAALFRKALELEGKEDNEAVAAPADTTNAHTHTLYTTAEKDEPPLSNMQEKRKSCDDRYDHIKDRDRRDQRDRNRQDKDYNKDRDRQDHRDHQVGHHDDRDRHDHSDRERQDDRNNRDRQNYRDRADHREDHNKDRREDRQDNKERDRQNKDRDREGHKDRDRQDKDRDRDDHKDRDRYDKDRDRYDKDRDRYDKDRDRPDKDNDKKRDPDREAERSRAREREQRSAHRERRELERPPPRHRREPSKIPDRGPRKPGPSKVRDIPRKAETTTHEPDVGSEVENGKPKAQELSVLVAAIMGRADLSETDKLTMLDGVIAKHNVIKEKVEGSKTDDVGGGGSSGNASNFNADAPPSSTENKEKDRSGTAGSTSKPDKAPREADRSSRERRRGDRNGYAAAPQTDRYYDGLSRDHKDKRRNPRSPSKRPERYEDGGARPRGGTSLNTHDDDKPLERPGYVPHARQYNDPSSLKGGGKSSKGKAQYAEHPMSVSNRQQAFHHHQDLLATRKETTAGDVTGGAASAKSTSVVDNASSRGDRGREDRGRSPLRLHQSGREDAGSSRDAAANYGDARRDRHDKKDASLERVRDLTYTRGGPARRRRSPSKRPVFSSDHIERPQLGGTDRHPAAESAYYKLQSENRKQRLRLAEEKENAPDYDRAKICDPETVLVGRVSDHLTPDGDHTVVHQAIAPTAEDPDEEDETGRARRGGARDRAPRKKNYLEAFDETQDAFSKERMIFVENTALAKYELKAGDILAVNIFHNGEGWQLADSKKPIWRIGWSTREAEKWEGRGRIPRFGDFVGHVYKKSKTQACFVFSKKCVAMTNEDPFVSKDDVGTTGIRVADELAFCVDEDASLMRNGISTPFWIRCREKGEVPLNERNNYDLIAEGRGVRITDDLGARAIEQYERERGGGRAERERERERGFGAERSSRDHVNMKRPAAGIPIERPDKSKQGLKTPSGMEKNDGYWRAASTERPSWLETADWLLLGDPKGIQDGTSSAKTPGVFEGQVNRVLNWSNNGFLRVTKGPKTENLEDVFIHDRVLRPTGLKEGDWVRFNLTKNRRGDRFCAIPLWVPRFQYRTPPASKPESRLTYDDRDYCHPKDGASRAPGGRDKDEYKGRKFETFDYDTRDLQKYGDTGRHEAKRQRR